jgi:uncharacterized cupin superfamily protein
MQNKKTLIALVASDLPPRAKPSIYPEPFASMMHGREKRQLGDIFGIKDFGINLTKLAPGARSALLHRHSIQEEFIYILEGCPTLITENEKILLQPGMCAGFTPEGVAHYLINLTENNVVYLEVGSRTLGDAATYPEDDLVANFNSEQLWEFTHKNGEKY